MLEEIKWGEVLVTTIGTTVSILAAFWLQRMISHDNRRQRSFDKREMCFIEFAKRLATLLHQIEFGSQPHESIRAILEDFSSEHLETPDKREINLLIGVYYHTSKKKCLSTLKRVADLYETMVDKDTTENQKHSTKKCCINIAKLCGSGFIRAILSGKDNCDRHSELVMLTVSVYLERQMKKAQKKLLDREVYYSVR